MFHGHEPPTWKPTLIFISTPFLSEHTTDPIRAHEINFDVSSSRVLNPDTNGNMFQYVEVILVHHVLRMPYQLKLPRVC